jgi:hypothetical protein
MIIFNQSSLRGSLDFTVNKIKFIIYFIVEIFREFKVLNGAIVLAHGSFLSILDISGTPIDKKTSKPVDTKWAHVNTQ